ncbi:MAG: DUF1553 domain-containing protein [Planctomycetota bacterium]|jgi:hypothetical protein
MGRFLLAAALLLAAPTGWADRPGALKPYERDEAVAGNVVDAAVQDMLRRHRIRPAPPASDVVFFRRIYLDVLGTLPTPVEVTAFLEDKRADKRTRLIDDLLARDGFATYASLKWCDLLRVKAEFPINLWPNAVQAYHRWIRDAIRNNRPYDQVARELLTASGSNFRVPAVNFWRAIQGRDAAARAHVVALTFMGTRIDKWPEERRDALALFFSRVAYKRTVEWKEEIVHNDPAPAMPIVTVFPDGRAARIPPHRDPRQVFADWLIRRDNPWFAKAIVNRIWASLLGRGIVHEPDDFRADNPPSNVALIEVLARELVLSGYDLRHVYRLILRSTTYQQSCIPRSPHPKAEALFAHYIVRRLDAEVLIDAICAITQSTEKYWSAVPEPFTFIPEDHRSIGLADGSITSPFLEMFGRPARDTGLWSERNNRFTSAQRLHLLNSTDISRRIAQGGRLRAIANVARRKPRRAIGALYMLILSRPPTPTELAAVDRYRRKSRLAPHQLVQDVVWALINSKEFLHAH